MSGDITFGTLNDDGTFVQLGRVENIPEISQNDSVDTTEPPDFTKGWELEFSLEPPKNYRELKPFIETIHPSFKWLIWWVNTYGCNNWRKMHGLPMMRKKHRNVVIENMNIDGFTLLLQDFCVYCPDFEPEIEKIDCSSLDDQFKCATNIRCVDRQKCARIAANLQKRSQGEYI